MNIDLKHSAPGGLILGFFLIMVLLISVAGVGIYYLQRMHGTLRDVVDVQDQQYRLATEMYIAARERALQLHAILQEQDPFERDELIPRFHELAGQFRGARERLLAMPLSEAERDMLREQAVHTTQGAILQDEVLDLALADRRQEAERLLVNQALPAQDQATVELRRLLDQQIADSRAASGAARAEYRLASGLMAGSTGVALFLAAVIASVVVNRQRRLMAKLRESEREARILLENIAMPVWYKHVDGRIDWFNPHFVSLMAPAAQSLAGTREAELWGQAAGLGGDQADRQALDNGQAGFQDLYLADADGGTRHFAITRTPIPANGKGWKGVLCVARDLTTMERMNDLLVTTNQELQYQKTALDEHAIVSIANPAGKITYVNEKFCAISGYGLAELLGQDHRIINSGVHSREFFEGLWSNIMQGRVWRGEVCNRAKDGSLFWLDSTIVPFLDDAGKPYQYVAIRTDITARKRLEDSLQDSNVHLQQRVEERTQALSKAMQELQGKYRQLEALHQQLKEAQSQLLQSEKLASIGQLAAGVAHEINNPIGFVQSNMGSLENYIHDLLRIIQAYEAAERSQTVKSPACAEVAGLREELDLEFLKVDIPDLLSESRDGINRVRKIVQDLKDFSRLDSSPEWQYADLHKGLDSTLNIAHNEIKYKADVVKEYGDIPEIECLLYQLNQVFMNLMVNAAHAMDGPRGTITLRTRREGENVVVEVSDTGKGIPVEIRERIFDPFFTTKPVGQGTGLGLSLAYGIIQKHHGRIEVDSEVGRGTTFRVTLPIKHAADTVTA
ncbi:MAG TPA: ATP-binding protein [Thiobacillaceae bacterium]|nr:ATP-binding protein [Thiobacillaceae bacterium]